MMKVIREEPEASDSSIQDTKVDLKPKVNVQTTFKQSIFKVKSDLI
jgi:hypothetical protein